MAVSSEREHERPSISTIIVNEEPELGMPKQAITVLSSQADTDLLKLDATINKVPALVLIDSGATGNFISQNLVSKCGIMTGLMMQPRAIDMADGREVQCSRFATVTWKCGSWTETLHLLVVPIKHDVILGTPWLAKHNDKLSIKWDQPRSVTIKQSPNHSIHLPVHWQNRPSTPTISLVTAERLPKHLSTAVAIYEVNVIEEKTQEMSKTLDISSGAPAEAQEELKQLISEYSSQFPNELPAGLPHERDIQHEIVIKPGSSIPNRPDYRHSIKELDALREFLDEAIKKGWLVTSNSPYGSPVIMVKKPDGSYRVCIDYRPLNAITVKNNYGLVRQDDLFDRLQGSQWFTKIDLRTGYYQIRMKPGDEYKTAIRTRYGHYEWTVMPMGLVNAPATFMHLMQTVFRQELDKFVVVYLDDILIYSKTLEEHMKHVRRVLELMKTNGLYGKLSKCSFLQKEVHFLGHILSGDGIRMDPKKIQAIMDWPEPTSISALRAFLGLAGYYRKFIKHFSRIAAPLTELTKKDVPYVFGDEERKAFTDLKTAVTTAPVLALPNLEKEFTVITDSSGFAVGAVLCQDHGEGLQPVSYLSHKMKHAETRYPVHEQELLAVKTALGEWRHYLMGRKFNIITDHRSLIWLQTQPKLSARQARWKDFFCEYDFEIQYAPGKTNVVADALSRRPDHKLELSTLVTIQGHPLRDEIKQAQQNDATTAKIISQVQSHPGYTLDQDGLLLFQNRIVIPLNQRLRTKLLSECHDSPLAGHLGVAKTYDRLSEHYYWPKMKQSIEHYCQSCLTCQQDKTSNQSPIGLLTPHDVPQRRWQVVSCDFITDLPHTERGYDSVFVVVDKLSKMVHFIPTQKTATAVQVARLFFDNIFKYHGLPETIISDRDTKFTSGFWQELWRLCGTRLNMSTAFHPQTDGQTERANRTLEDMLRHYVDDHQKDWDLCLTAAEFACNSAVQTSTGYSPFFLNYGADPANPLRLSTLDESNTPAADQIVRGLAADIQQAKDNLQAAISRQAYYANKHRREHEFKEGEKVMLSAKRLDLVQKGTSTSLAPKNFGPVRIIKKVSPVAYKVELPDSWSNHPVFHVSQLTPFHEDDEEQFPDRPLPKRRDFYKGPDNDDQFEVERIVAEKQVKSGRQTKTMYLTKWKNYPDHDNTWEPRANFIEPDGRITQALIEWEQQQDNAQTVTTLPVTESPEQPQSTTPQPKTAHTVRYLLRNRDKQSPSA